MKEWNCDEFVVDEASVKSPTSGANHDRTNPNKIMEPAFNLLHTVDDHAGALQHPGNPKNQTSKDFNHGLLRYELTSDFDIDAWHCKDTADSSAKIVYAVPNEEHKEPDAPQSNLAIQDSERRDQGSYAMPEEWRRILKEGLLNETKMKLIKKYEPVKNCGLFEEGDAAEKKGSNLVPQLTKSAVATTEKVTYHAEMQDQLGTGISAIVTALSALRDRHGVSSKQIDAVVESLTDAGKIFTHLHHHHTTSKRALLDHRPDNDHPSTTNNAVGKPANKCTPRRGESDPLRKHGQLVETPNEFTGRRESRSNRAGEPQEPGRHLGNNSTTRDPMNFESPDEETTSQRVKRLLCGITDEEYRMKKKREGPDVFPGIVEILKQARALHGVHEELLLSWPCNAGAVKRYQKPIKLWWDYCQRESINVYDVSVARLKSFFVEITREEPKSYEILHVYKTAILLLTPEKLEKDRLFTEFLKEISIESHKT